MHKLMVQSLTRGAMISAASLALASVASANIAFSVDNTSPFAAQGSFLSGAGASQTEDFEADGSGNYAIGAKGSADGNGPGFSTAVGTFDRADSAVDGDAGGQCEKPCERIWVMNQADADFSGRYDTTDGDGNQGTEPGQWLDSNDVSAFTWNIGGLSNINALGFFLMDPTDQGATLTIDYENGSATKSISNQSNGSLYYISAIADSSINGATLEFANTAGDVDGDGFGIDDVTVARVPEPATLGLIGVGLIGLGFASRRRPL